MIKLAITGCTGRMGQMLLRQANQNTDTEIVGALTREENPFIGQDIGTLIGEAPLNIMITSDPHIAFQDADTIIDFSKPEGLNAHLKAACKLLKPYIVCTTGLNEVHKIKIEEASQIIPIIVAPNTSLGIAVLRKLALDAAKILGPSYDISIMDIHHRDKADAPSGTSLSIAQTLANLDHLNNSKPPYPSHSPRKEGTIEIASLRGGNFIGNNEVIFAGDMDMIRIEHQANDRALYAQGAIKAAQWLKGKPYGLFSMDDVVGLDL